MAFKAEQLAEEKTARAAVAPMDVHNQALLEQVHPEDWSAPVGDARYNMVVVGAGTGGLVTAAAVAGLGGKVALVEEDLMGGDCLNFGCVPSKALLRSARAAAEVRRAGDFGVHVDGEIRVDFAQVMERMRKIRAEISHHDSAARFSELGVDVFLGRGVFTGEDSVLVGDAELGFANACIATGASAAIPDIPGLAEAPYLTHHTLFNLTELPARFGVIGGGAIGAEMAQAFARLGAQVTLYERQDQLLPREEPEAAEVVRRALERDGVRVCLNASLTRVSSRVVGGPEATGPVELHSPDTGSVEVDALLVAAGRRPNVQDIGLERAGVDFDDRVGIKVDARLRTTNPRIWAVGDVATSYRFTHAADFMARLVVRNALFFGRSRVDDLIIPWCTYTDPEVARVGRSSEELARDGVAFDTFTRALSDVDRARIDGDTEGFVRVHVRRGGDAILGATVVGRHAGDLIGELTLALRAGKGLGFLADVIHPYPTLAESIRQVGDQYNRTRLTPRVRSWMGRFLGWRR